LAAQQVQKAMQEQLKVSTNNRFNLFLALDYQFVKKNLSCFFKKTSSYRVLI